MQATNRQPTINRTQHTSNYVVLPNSIVQNNQLSHKAYRIYAYLISLPSDWKIIPKRVAKYLKMGRDAVYKGLNELCQYGFATLERGQRTAIWRIFDTPQKATDAPIKAAPTKLSENPDIQDPNFQHALQSKEIKKNTKKPLQQTPDQKYQSAPSPSSEPVAVTQKSTRTQKNPIQQQGQAAPLETTQQATTTTNKIIQTAIVEQPVLKNLQSNQQAAITKLLAQVNEEQLQLILHIFNIAQAKQAINNPIGYLYRLVKAAQEGTLTTPIIPPKPKTLSERIREEQKQRDELLKHHAMNYEEYVAYMKQRYKTDITALPENSLIQRLKDAKRRREAICAESKSYDSYHTI